MRKFRICTQDKKILKLLLQPCGGGVPLSSKQIATKLGLAATTVQRRRIRLHKEKVLATSYDANLKMFGLQKVDFLISTGGGKTMNIVKALSKMKDVTSITRTVGQPTIDLNVETVQSGNEGILNMLETIKAMDGVTDAVWSGHVVEVLRKSAIPAYLIDRL